MSRVAAERTFFREHPGAVFDEAWHVAAQQVIYAVEDYLAVLPELRGLYPAHWAEIALDHDAIKLDPDYESYERMANAGILHLVTARNDGELVGYHLSMIHPHLHYRASLTCFTDVFYLKPEYRQGMIGYRLLKTFRDSAKARGVQKIYMGTKLARDIGPLLARLGFTPIERLYSMVFR
jgi:GNAT superfamily N-acetyltransferase